MLGKLFSRDLNLVWAQNLLLLTAYTIVNALMPLYIRQAGYPDTTNGLVMGTGSLGILVSLLLMGRWIDQGEPRWFIAAGALLWMATAALMAAAPLIWILVVCRFLQGFAYALFYTASLVYATRAAPGELRGAVVGIVEAVGAFAIALTPFFALPAAIAWGYPITFGLAALLSLLTALIVLPLSAQVAPAPALDTPAGKGVLSRHALIPGLVGACLFCVAVAYVNLAPLIAQSVGVASISLYMGLRALGTVPTRLASGYIADRYGPSWVVVPGLLVAMAAMALLPVLTGPSWAYLVPALFGLGMGNTSPALTAWMLQKVPAHERAVAINTFIIYAEGSGFFGSWLVGGLLQSGQLTGFLLLAALLGVGLVIYAIAKIAGNKMVHT